MSQQFWDVPSSEPKRKFRWLLYFSGAPQFIIKSVQKPSFNVGTTAHQFLQHTFNFPGRVTWQDISMTLVDPVNPDATKSIMEIIKSSGYVNPDEGIVTDATKKATISKENMVTSLGNYLKIQQIGADGAGTIIEEWKVWNPQITSAQFDSLDYSSDDPINIQLGFKYDWAELKSEYGGDAWVRTVYARNG